MSPSGVPETGQDLLKGEEELRMALEGFRRDSEAYRENFIEALEAKVGFPLRKAFAEALNAHTRLREAAGLEDSGGEAGGETGRDPADPAATSPALRGRRFRQYREGVRQEVLEPLHRSLRELEAGREVGNRWVGFQNGLPGLADRLPSVILRKEPEDLYWTRAGDSRATASRKRLIRTERGIREFVGGFGRRLARLFRRVQAPPPPRTQQVPLRPLTKESLLYRYPLSLRGISDSLQDHYARPVAQLGSALSRWTDDWFDAEVGAQAAEGRLGARFRDEILRGIPIRPDPKPQPPEGTPEAEETVGKDATPIPPGTPELEEISRALSEALRSGASLPPPSEPMQQMRQAMEREWEQILEAVRVAGSFQEPSVGNRGPARVRRLLDRDQKQVDAWQNWHANTLERFLVTTLLLKLRDSFDQAEDGIQGRIVEEVLAPLMAPWKGALVGLRRLEGAVEETFTSHGTGADASELAAELEALRARALSYIESDLIGVLAQEQPEIRIHRIADEVSGKLSDSLRFLPESVRVAPLHRGTGRIAPTQSVKELPVRETVHQTLDVLRLEAIRNSPSPILSFLETAATEFAELPNIVSYNLSMAAEELRSPAGDSEEKAVANARSLTTDGLTRTADWVESLLGNLATAWVEFREQIRGLLERSFGEIHDRAVAEGAVEEQMLGLRAWARSRIRTGSERGRVAARWAGRNLKSYSRRAWVLGAKLVRIGQSAVGVQVSREGETEHALDALRWVPDLLESLPLVYRRLFSLNPISDPSLLVGRDAELTWVARRLEAWKAGFGSPCILTGPVGVGHTSFLNVLEGTKLKDYDTRRIDLDRRIRTESALASLMAETLGFEEDAPWTFSRLARNLRDMPPASGKPLVILVEHVEHLFLRVSGGTDLLEDFFSFQALTANQVFWLSTTSGAAWKLLEKNEPRAAGLLARLPFPPLSRRDVETAIMVRHLRSGLPLEFVPPTDLNPLVRRKLRLSLSDKAKQEIIRTEYFDRVFRVTQDSITLTMLTWLRSADFASREGRLLVSPADPIRFSFLEELDLTLDFALKAFLEHGSLTLEEYEQVFNSPEEEAFQVFETLRNLLLIAPMGARGGHRSGFEVTKEGEGYRVRPLLSQVVANHLKSRNILH